MPEPRPITATDGGVVDPDDLVGRDRELVALARAVASTGAQVLGDRRMGKTSTLRRLERDLRAVGHVVARVSAETDDPATFGESLLIALNAALPRRGRGRRGSELTVEGHLEVGPAGVTITRSSQREAASEPTDLFSWCARELRSASGHRVVFILDEISVLAQAMAEKEEGAAEEFLRSLRRTRQQVDGVSMVLAGSIGLHHVVRDITVLNDLSEVDVGPLSHEDAVYLAQCLLLGEHVPTEDRDRLARVLATAASDVPYYVQKLVVALATAGLADPSADDVDDLVDVALQHDSWQTSHYVTRLPTWYGPAAGLARSALDEYALSDAALTVDQLLERLGAQPLEPRPTREDLLGLVPRLERDHYLRREGAADRFATPLLRRAWLAHRRLA